MTEPRILVTGATGKTGLPTAQQLLEKGFRVRALVRREDARSVLLRTAGAEVVVGSLTDFDDLERALSDVQRAYFCAPVLPGYLTAAATFAAAARAARLESLVIMSQWLSDPGHPAAHTRECWLADSLLSSLPGVGVTINNVGFFADNYMYTMEPMVQLGMLPMPLGDGTNAPPSNEDIARVTVGALANPAVYAGRSYRPTGPKLLSPQELAETFARLLGRPVVYKPLSMALFGKMVMAMNVVSEYAAAALLHYLVDYQQNTFGVGAPTDAVEEVGGQPPEPFESIARRYVAAMGPKRRLGGKAEQMWILTKAMFQSGPRSELVNHRDHVSSPEHLRFSADSPRWRATHGAPAMVDQSCVESPMIATALTH